MKEAQDEEEKKKSEAESKDKKEDDDEDEDDEDKNDHDELWPTFVRVNELLPFLFIVIDVVREKWISDSNVLKFPFFVIQ